MRNYISFSGILLSLMMSTGCDKSKKKEETVKTSDTINAKTKIPEKEIASAFIKNKPADFVPKGYVVFDKIFGDLNKDSSQDRVLIIKGTDKSNIITDEYRGVLDRNRRGIIILLNKNGIYELATKNYDCFSSENEDGGVYYAPELDFGIEKGNLLVNYAHGRYGYWSYTFRYQNNDMELIGYDSSENRGPVTQYQTSINYLTKTKIVNENMNKDSETEEEVFQETVTKINRAKLTKLSEIKDFDELDEE